MEWNGHLEQTMALTTQQWDMIAVKVVEAP
jgi:hypothetical protein